HESFPGRARCPIPAQLGGSMLEVRCFACMGTMNRGPSRAGRKAPINRTHSRRFARFGDARRSRSVWSACVFSAAFPKQAPIRWRGRFMESHHAIFAVHWDHEPTRLLRVLEDKPPNRGRGRGGRARTKPWFMESNVGPILPLSCYKIGRHHTFPAWIFRYGKTGATV